MGRSDGSETGAQRRTVLKLLSAAAGAQLVPAVGADQLVEREFAVVQGDDCIPVTPLTGDEPVEELYDWRAADTGYSSAGTTDLQRDDTSILFLYEGPNGTSLVLVHGHYRGDEDNGASVSMTFDGLPESGEWVVEDDLYDGDSNYDNWEHDGTRSEIDWTVRYNRTDGGAFRGLGDGTEIRIEPAFNDESEFGDEYYESELTDWQVLSGDRDDPDRTSLAMDAPIVIRAGGCETTEGSDGSGDGTEEETANSGGEESEETDDDSTDEERKDDEEEEEEEDDDKRRTKHEKKQRKHEKKHELKQRKHEKKHEKQQRKHEKKHEKQQRKHEKERKKHEKRRRKNRRKRREKHEKGSDRGRSGKRRGRKRRSRRREDSEDLGGLLDELSDSLGDDD